MTRYRILVAALLLPPAVAAQVPAARATAAVSGVVVDGSSGQPLPGAAVALIRRTGAPLAGSQRVLTDPRGRFVFTDLAGGGGYSIQAEAAGYLVGEYGRSTPGSTLTSFPLADNEWLSTVRITLWKPGAISGTVVDEHGAPLVGIYVRVLTHLRVAGRPHVAAGPHATTDDRGAYRVAGLLPGRYMVHVPVSQGSQPTAAGPLASVGRSRETADLIDLDDVQQLAVGRYPVPAPAAGERRLLAYLPTFHPAARAIAAASAIDIGYGEERRAIDLQLTPVPAVRLAGKVLGSPEGLAGLTLRLVPEGSEGLGIGADVATAWVGEGGAFTFPSVPAGSYLLEGRSSLTQLEFRPALGPAAFLLDGLLPPSITRGGSSMNSSDVPSGPPGTQLVTRSFGQSSSEFVHERVTVGNDGLADLVVTLRRGARMTGRILWEGGTPPTFVAVTAEAAGGEPSLGVARRRAPLQGIDNFTLDGLLPGEYVLRLRTSTFIVKSIASGGRDATYLPFDASDGRDFDDVVVTMTDKVAALTGTVRDDRGRETGSAAVILFPVERDQWSRYGFTPPRIRSALSASGGRFDIGALPAGDYFVLAVDAARVDAWQDPSFLAAAERVAARISIGWGESRTVDLAVTTVR